VITNLVLEVTDNGYGLGALTFGVILHPLITSFTASVALKSRI